MVYIFTSVSNFVKDETMTNIYDVSYEVFLLREIFNFCLIIALMIFATFLFSKMREILPPFQKLENLFRKPSKRKAIRFGAHPERISFSYLHPLLGLFNESEQISFSISYLCD
jgi:hypothetical protein